MTGFKRRTIHIRCLTAAICLVLLFNSPEPMVLCIGQNGHVAIEASGSRCCGHLLRLSCCEDVCGLVGADHPVRDDDCGACFDIPISSGLREALEAPNEVLPDTGVLFLVSFSLLDFSTFLGATADSELIVAPPCSTSLRSVVLLI